ncbi:putative flavin-containing monooxygenase [Clohesyomyces aquaticus]|uniref:Putative flavin-containing monooxygenase n=1 Tax=Clohesyomyces aquaticus TaxID=1231657 RepID=A0A1Y2A5J1_9PLEO|nr:putative flavin-containing monooxygenase [Clohesyomyces aquaticus]
MPLVSDRRRVPVSSLPGSLPTTSIPADTDVTRAARRAHLHLRYLKEADLVQGALWRDTYALTGTLRTIHSAAAVVEAWRAVCKIRNPTSFHFDKESAQLVRIGDIPSWVDVHFTFKTASPPKTTCSGILSLVPDPADGWKIWVIRTILEQLDGENSVDRLEPSQYSARAVDTNPITNDAHTKTPSEFDAVVVGGGQAGLSVAGRLKALGISYVLIDKNKEVGDNWKLRYGSARLHTTRQYSHLPFNRTFPSHYQEWLTKDDLARGYKDWVKTYNINIWLSTTLSSGTWDSTTKRWTLQIERDGAVYRLCATHVVLAVGAGGQIPTMPVYPNRELFNGTILHSAQYTEPSAFKGKHGIVVGTANTAHDIAEDMLGAGLASVTMVQRSPTYVLPVEYYQRVQDLLYNDEYTTEYADRMSFSHPLAVGRQLALAGLHAAARAEPARFDALEAAGFKLERYGDITHYISERMGGHYMDVGASKKIADGSIKIKANALPAEYTRDGIRFQDGEELPADFVVFATGFDMDMKTLVESFFGKEVAAEADDYWGVDEEGELLGAFKPNSQPGLWYHGGSLGNARYYSRFIALSISAQLKGTPPPIYGRNGYEQSSHKL